MTTGEIESQLEEARKVLRSDPRLTVAIVRGLIASGDLSVQQRLDSLLLCSRAHILLGQYDLGRPLAEQALELADLSSEELYRGRANNELGIYCFVEQRFDRGLQHYAAAEHIFKALNSQEDLAKVYLNVANTYQISGQVHDSITMYERALQLARETNDVLTQAKVLVNLAGLYRTVVYDPDTAYQYMVKAHEIYTRLNDRVGLAKAKVTIGVHYMSIEENEKALGYLEDALELRSKGAEPGELLMNYDAILSALIRLGRTELARERFAELKSLFPTETTDAYNQNWISASEVRLLLSEGKIDDALVKWNGVQQWLNDVGFEHVLVDIEELLAIALEEHGRFKDSTALWRALVTKRVSVARERAQARLSWFKAKLELSHAQSEAEIERIRNVELASAVERLEELHRENEQYVAFLAHELKSPLNTIRAISAMLGTDANVGIEERMEFAREVNRISSRMFDLINQTLEVSKHRLHRSGSITNAKTVWDHVVSAMKNIAAEKQISLQCQCDSDEYLVVSSEQPLVTIIENLLSNALKFSPPGSTIMVRTQLRGSPARAWYVHLSVADHGPGLSPDDAARLFRPFETLTARPTENESSTGLGLHIVQRTVNMLNGRIWCESELGKGATFHIELPLAETEGVR